MITVLGSQHILLPEGEPDVLEIVIFCMSHLVVLSCIYVRNRPKLLSQFGHPALQISVSVLETEKPDSQPKVATNQTKKHL